MPKNVLPEAAKVLPKQGQRLWLRIFNEELGSGKGESGASQTAWAAVKRAGYGPNKNGKWSKSMDNEFLLNEDGTFEIGVPLVKVNVQKRIVEGFATLDNVDEAGDRVTSDASLDAFNNWFGNIREMHAPTAVGKAIDFKQDTYTDPESGQTYNGVWVKAKISKGAEDTWQKVLDGTLAGFSIGGMTQEKERDVYKSADGTEKPIWNITKYRLTELSLVDSPCNRLATISLVKSIDGNSHVEDVIADGDLEKAYDGATGDFVDLSDGLDGVIKALEAWRTSAIEANADREVIRASEMLTYMRSRLRDETNEAEWREQEKAVSAAYAGVAKSDDNNNLTQEDKMEKNEEEISSADLQDNELSDNNIIKSEVPLTEDERNVLRKFIDFFKGETETASGEDELEKSEDTNKEATEPIMNEEEVQKAIDEATGTVTETLTKSVDEQFTQVGESLKAIQELMEKAATSESLDDIKKSLEELESRVKSVEESGAVKKSGDDAGDASEDKIEKSEGLWSGDILPEFMLRKDV